MIGAWMLYTMAVTALLFAAALPTEYVMRALGRQTRFVWAAVLALAIALPTARLFRGPDATALSAPKPSTPAPWPTAAAGPILLSTSTALDASLQVRRTVAAIDVSPLDRWNQSLIVGWIALSLVALGYLAVGMIAVRRLERRLAPNVVDGHAVLLSRDVGPALFGVIRARLVLPRWVLALGEAERRIILTHETEHASAHDPALLLAGLILLALQPWNLALWLVVARLRYSIETDCDARVLEGAVDARSYGLLLVRVHAQSTPFAGAQLAFVGTTSKLENRIRRIVRGRPRAVSVTTAGAMLAAAVLVLSAWVAPLPRHTPRFAPPRTPAQTVVDRLKPPIRFDSSRPITDTIVTTPKTELLTLEANSWKRTLDSVAVQPPPQIMIPASSGSCGESLADPTPTRAQLTQWARERHPDIMDRVPAGRVTVIGFIIDRATCTVARDTAVTTPFAPQYDAGDMFKLAFPGTPLPEAFGLAAGNDRLPSNLMITYGIPMPKQQDSEDCTFGKRMSDVCSLDGGVVIRVMDSVRVLIGVVGPDGAVDSTRESHLFLFTSSEPLPALLTRTINYAHVEYSGNELYVVSRSSADPPVLFRIPTKESRIRRTDNVAAFEHGAGMSLYLWQGLTSDKLRRLKPAAACKDGVVRASCYEINGRAVQFPL